MNIDNFKIIPKRDNPISECFRQAAALLIESEKPLFVYPAFMEIARDSRQALMLLKIWQTVFKTGGEAWPIDEREARALGCLFLAEMYSSFDTFLESVTK